VGGETIFNNASTADTATLIANGGTNGGEGGAIFFEENSTGGTVRVEVFGNGILDVSGHNSPGVTIGSIEGEGDVFLGTNNLAVGSINLSTSFFGVIQDGGFGASMTKIDGTWPILGQQCFQAVRIHNSSFQAIGSHFKWRVSGSLNRSARNAQPPREPTRILAAKSIKRGVLQVDDSISTPSSAGEAGSRVVELIG
jgi:hypothetical protein